MVKRVEKVAGYITITYDFKDTFPTEWDDDQIKDFIEKNFKEYLDEEKAQLQDIEITEIEDDEEWDFDYEGE